MSLPRCLSREAAVRVIVYAVLAHVAAALLLLLPQVTYFIASVDETFPHHLQVHLHCRVSSAGRPYLCLCVCVCVKPEQRTSICPEDVPLTARRTVSSQALPETRRRQRRRLLSSPLLGSRKVSARVSRRPHSTNARRQRRRHGRRTTRRITY